jgi:hypothetical protein
MEDRAHPFELAHDMAGLLFIGVGQQSKVRAPQFKPCGI